MPFQSFLAHLAGEEKITPAEPPMPSEEELLFPDYAEVKGQENVKRALEVAAAGGHNVLMVGPPGSGKSMLAKRLPGILPDMSREETMESTGIWSVCGLTDEKRPILRQRPFRAPHHTLSAAAMAGGAQLQPGEVSLAHNGVLFLDELPEYHRDVLEVMRQPLEDGVVTVSRAAGTAVYPSRFMLVCAMNPCKCGWYGQPGGRCRCSEKSVRAYHAKLSGPLMDRIDIIVEVPALAYDELRRRPDGESSETIRQRVNHAREVQRKRFFLRHGIQCQYVPARYGAVLLSHARGRRADEGRFPRAWSHGAKLRPHPARRAHDRRSRRGEGHRARAYRRGRAVPYLRFSHLFHPGGHAMNRFDAVLFDLDGTLLYTLADIAAAVNGALREMHRPERTVTEIRSMVGNGAKMLITRALGPGQEALIDDTLAVYARLYAAHAQEHVTSYAGIRSFWTRCMNAASAPRASRTRTTPTPRRCCKSFSAKEFPTLKAGSRAAPQSPRPTRCTMRSKRSAPIRPARSMSAIPAWTAKRRKTPRSPASSATGDTGTATD